ncbi:serine hydrolase [Bradyrhizobium guangzhouense]|uniref:serine hydrolase n=1 Tax=Bradyrhizobium guangzhouense TaxID=1325095 RepID=UPI00100992A4|nr:serine hydrolase [Bradyrhizobium guangzhouense]RXH07480.1 serine hydrolase [Bradyrhizobium guangzhouense]
MIHRRDFLLGAIAASIAGAQARAQAVADDEVRNILHDRIDGARQSVGIVAVSFASEDEKITTYGRSGAKNDRQLDGDTVFEIGSITKVFTALLLTEMVTRGEVALNDPVAKYLPAGVAMPTRNGKQITFLDLASYTSGLPRIPDGIPTSGGNPYAAYTVEQLYAFLSNHTLRFDPGTHYEYSNLGFGLLGHVLALRADASYEDLLVSRICLPLGLEDTRISLTSSMRDRLAQGHSSTLEPTSNWDLPALAGAGALRSTANDLVKFVKATCLSGADAPLRQAIDMLVQTRRLTNLPNTEVGLGCFIRRGNSDEIIYKDGETGGYASFAGFSTKLRSGAVVLSNSTNLVNDIGFRLTNPAYNIAQYPPEVTVDPAVLVTYQGTYEMGPKFALGIRAEAGRLFVRGTGQPEFELFAESENRFFMRFVDAQGTFLRDKDGAVDRLLWHQNGRYTYCPRVP